MKLSLRLEPSINILFDDLTYYLLFIEKIICSFSLGNVHEPQNRLLHFLNVNFEIPNAEEVPTVLHIWTVKSINRKMETTIDQVILIPARRHSREAFGVRTL